MDAQRRSRSGESVKDNINVNMVNETPSSKKVDTFVPLEEDDATSNLGNIQNIPNIQNMEIESVQDFLEQNSGEAESVYTCELPGQAVSRSTPLSPVIIPINSLENDASIIVSSTPESDVYAQIPVKETELVKNQSCPYLTDLKEHFITIGRKNESCTTKKSRGTFSPQPKTRTTLRSIRSSPNYQII